MCSLGIEPTTFALLTQLYHSTTEPQEHCMHILYKMYENILCCSKAPYLYPYFELSSFTQWLLSINVSLWAVLSFMCLTICVSHIPDVCSFSPSCTLEKTFKVSPYLNLFSVFIEHSQEGRLSGVYLWGQKESVYISTSLHLTTTPQPVAWHRACKSLWQSLLIRLMPHKYFITHRNIKAEGRGCLIHVSHEMAELKYRCPYVIWYQTQFSGKQENR